MDTARTGAIPHLEIDLARTLVAISETRNFSKAAEQVHRTPSAISLQVKRLEETVGRPLFRRGTRSVSLTSDGETLLGFARRLLKLNEEAMAHFLVPQVEGKVSLGAPHDSGIFAIPGFLKRFASTHPHVEVEVKLDSSASLRRRCAAGELDLVLFTSADGGLPPVEPVYTEALVWIGLRHGEAVHRTPLPLALANQGCAWRAMALAALDAQGIAYRAAYSSEYCQGQIAAVEADLAVAPLPLSVVTPPFVRLGEDFGLPPLGNYTVFMRRRDGAGPVVDALAEHVGASFRDLSGRGNRLFA